LPTARAEPGRPDVPVPFRVGSEGRAGTPSRRCRRRRIGTEKHGHAVKRQHGFFAGTARIAVLPAATAVELGAFLKG
jgi:hypothetical protein